jgi:hypothetical protein
VYAPSAEVSWSANLQISVFAIRMHLRKVSSRNRAFPRLHDIDGYGQNALPFSILFLFSKREIEIVSVSLPRLLTKAPGSCTEKSKEN